MYLYKELGTYVPRFIVRAESLDVTFVMLSQRNEDEKNERPHSDFSIDHILNRAGSNLSSSGSESFVVGDSSSSFSLDHFSWLQCSRYCPPKIPRSQKKEGPQRRQLGRHPRIPFTSHQLAILERKFKGSPYLSSEEVTRLSNELNLADIRVKIWFQNRRARERRERPRAATETLNRILPSNEVSTSSRTADVSPERVAAIEIPVAACGDLDLSPSMRPLHFLAQSQQLRFSNSLRLSESGIFVETENLNNL